MDIRSRYQERWEGRKVEIHKPKLINHEDNWEFNDVVTCSDVVTPRNVSLGGYMINQVPYFAAAWEKSTGLGWASAHDMNEATFMAENQKQEAIGLKVSHLSLSPSLNPVYSAI